MKTCAKCGNVDRPVYMSYRLASKEWFCRDCYDPNCYFYLNPDSSAYTFRVEESANCKINAAFNISEGACSTMNTAVDWHKEYVIECARRESSQQEAANNERMYQEKLQQCCELEMQLSEANAAIRALSRLVQ